MDKLVSRLGGRMRLMSRLMNVLQDLLLDDVDPVLAVQIQILSRNAYCCSKECVRDFVACARRELRLRRSSWESVDYQGGKPWAFETMRTVKEAGREEVRRLVKDFKTSGRVNSQFQSRLKLGSSFWNRQAWNERILPALFEFPQVG